MKGARSAFRTTTGEEQAMLFLLIMLVSQRTLAMRGGRDSPILGVRKVDLLLKVKRALNSGGSPVPSGAGA